ncbi:MAG: hypothetical protein OYH77_01120, partial [Pseudomonadota bacterium]|nr:hypothetical protein [Pseudomonadota bacterium]
YNSTLVLPPEKVDTLSSRRSSFSCLIAPRCIASSCPIAAICVEDNFITALKALKTDLLPYTGIAITQESRTVAKVFILMLSLS